MRAYLIFNYIRIATGQLEHGSDEPVVSIMVLVTAVARTVVREIGSVRTVATLEEVVPHSPVEIT